jgi:hypothetical protein
LVRVPLSVELDGDSPTRVELLDPAGELPRERSAAHQMDGRLEFEIPSLPEGAVELVRLQTG